MPIDKIRIVITLGLWLFSSCEKHLEPDMYAKSPDTAFFQSAGEAGAAVTAMYAGMTGAGLFEGGWGGSNYGWKIQSSMETDETICSWGWAGWKRMNQLIFSIDDGVIVGIYTAMMPLITQITININKVGKVVNMDSKLKARYIAELKALRAHYSQILYNLYGPVPVRLDPAAAADPRSAPMPRPSKDSMVYYIERDYKEAEAVLPAMFSGSDYGRFSGTACLMGLMKLYMKQRRWQDAIAMGEQIRARGLHLVPDYTANFSYDNKGGNAEIILAIPCNANSPSNYNNWLANVLPTDPAYVDPSGMPLQRWGGYKMPWSTYDKFDSTDRRLQVLLRRYPVDAKGTLFDARTGGVVNGEYYPPSIGAIPKKYGIDPTSTTNVMGTDIVVWRYADVELLLAEALNEINGFPVTEAYNLINDVRQRAGVKTYAYGSLRYSDFKERIMDERLFELWCEGQRREDMIRWGTFIKDGIRRGASAATLNDTLYPLPRKVITETGDVVKQNPGY